MGNRKRSESQERMLELSDARQIGFAQGINSCIDFIHNKASFAFLHDLDDKAIALRQLSRDMVKYCKVPEDEE